MSAVASPVTTALAVADRVAVACFRMFRKISNSVSKSRIESEMHNSDGTELPTF